MSSVKVVRQLKEDLLKEQARPGGEGRNEKILDILQRLEKAGVLTREKDASDPRARVVRIAAGAPLETGLDVLDGLEERAVASLSARQRAQLPGLLDRMTAALQLTE